MNHVARDLVDQLIEMGCDVTAIGDERYVVGESGCLPPLKIQTGEIAKICSRIECAGADIIAYLHELGRVEPVEYH